MAPLPVEMVFSLLLFVLLPSICYSLDPSVCGGQEKALLDFRRCDVDDVGFFDGLLTKCVETCEPSTDGVCRDTCALQTIRLECGRGAGVQEMIQRNYGKLSNGLTVTKEQSHSFIEKCLNENFHMTVSSGFSYYHWIPLFVVGAIAVVELVVIVVLIGLRFRGNRQRAINPTANDQEEGIEVARSGDEEVEGVNFLGDYTDYYEIMQHPPALRNFDNPMKDAYRKLRMKTGKFTKNEVINKVEELYRIMACHSRIQTYIVTHEKNDKNEKEHSILKKALDDQINKFVEKARKTPFITYIEIVQKIGALFQYSYQADYKQYIETLEEEVHVLFKDYISEKQADMDKKKKDADREAAEASLKAMNEWYELGARYFIRCFRQSATLPQWNSVGTFVTTVPDLNMLLLDENVRRIVHFGLPSAQKIRIFDNIIIVYNNATKLPHCVLEYLSPDSDNNKETERSGNFKEDKKIDPLFRLKDADYKHTGFDRGHMAAAANHRASDSDMKNTFHLSNVIPQSKNLNEHAWKALEEAVRETSKRVAHTWVCSGPAFVCDVKEGEMRYKVIVKKGRKLYIPTHVFKIALYQKRCGTFIMDCYLVPNTEMDTVVKHRKKRQEIEAAVGFRIFEEIADNMVKSSTNERPLNNILQV